MLQTLDAILSVGGHFFYVTQDGRAGLAEFVDAASSELHRTTPGRPPHGAGALPHEPAAGADEARVRPAAARPAAGERRRGGRGHPLPPLRLRAAAPWWGRPGRAALRWRR